MSIWVRLKYFSTHNFNGKTNNPCSTEAILIYTTNKLGGWYTFNSLTMIIILSPWCCYLRILGGCFKHRRHGGVVVGTVPGLIPGSTNGIFLCGVCMCSLVHVSFLQFPKTCRLGQLDTQCDGLVPYPGCTPPCA